MIDVVIRIEFRIEEVTIFRSNKYITKNITIFFLFHHVKEQRHQ